MGIKMIALRTFAGAEGFLRRGQTFEALNETRARSLSEAKLAERVEEESVPSEKENPDQQAPPENKVNLREVHLIEPVEGPEIIEPSEVQAKLQEQKAVVRHVGGGWYELPNGVRIRGKENALAEYEAYLKESGEA
ncbi:hypothetical protein SAMN04487777_11775 [Priestia aryabhattai B8W22]|uniref:hypothetical protein n=1 Tax=Priestia aryabhattai TaxID=412384 RepID=UPI00088E4CD4|nr:hypothetical protein SAMN04487777_11775 [Priestia aryabhattai B8W22]